ncbi:hypothetical protein FFT09_04580 [Saccharomonospora piscinae]|uniref:hypothetical protein n=1 Tax=Saccharomonospora piscinae TaxID=687388 RepID=UPI0011057706|nr:hypothetical protein [Saccharomonospora piscinae]TLW95128.1 hypothetical protein FFT09_04580 [Saccharomonospora piscinae]
MLLTVLAVALGGAGVFAGYDRWQYWIAAPFVAIGALGNWIRYESIRDDRRARTSLPSRRDASR